jgi:hypothetical protein
MTAARSVSRGAWILLVLGALHAGAAWFVLLQRPPESPANGELALLAGERTRLQGNDDSERDAWRRKRDALRQQAWTAESREALSKKLGATWHWEWLGENRAALRRTNPSLAEWPEYVALITKLGAEPGLIIETFEVFADGPAQARRFTRVQLGLKFILPDAAIGDSERAAPSRSPLPVAPADGPAPARKVGSVSPLRPPAASAEPPARGATSVSFRSDPPGNSAGTSTNQHQQDKLP